MMKKWLYPVSLILIFIILTIVIIPDGYVYGSNTDWLSQHVTLAETIRNACLEQHTLLPSWINLGGGSNGYQFAYYGFLRPDILIGCLFPHISMLTIIISYMLTIYLGSVLLCFAWLRSEDISLPGSWLGSILFMTAGCLFHMHRQIMFVNYLPFLLLAFLCIRKRRRRWLPLWMLLICLSSFYFSISAFAAIGWYWYRTEGRAFWKDSFLKRYVTSAVIAAAMAAALLIPTELVLLEHKRSGGGLNLLKLLELFGPNPAFNNILFNEYGTGLTLICFYAILAGLRIRNIRKDSILFLLFGMFGFFSYILNGTLYARPKILIPFMPLMILHCVRFLKIQKVPATFIPSERRLHASLPLWPFAVMIPVSLLWFSQVQFPWIIAELGILFFLCILSRISKKYPHIGNMLTPHIKTVLKGCCVFFLLVAPTGMYIATAGTEDWVKRSDISPGFTSDELAQIHFDPLYHFDSLISPLISGNELNSGQIRSTMYSSVTNGEYSSLYYDTLMTPIRINNRVALLTSDNPFMLQLLGVRYLETTEEHIPAGYQTICQSGENVIAENKNVLPAVYFTDDTVSQKWFDTLSPLEQLDVITSKTVILDSGQETAESDNNLNTADNSRTDHFTTHMRDYTPELKLSDGSSSASDDLHIRQTEGGWEITAKKSCTLTLNIENPAPGNIVLCQFQVKNLTTQAVVIDINNIRNKLSGMFAPYPNGNDCFHYQFATDSETGVNRLEITFSKGHYRLTDLQWYLYDQELLQEKTFTPLSPGGTITADNNGYLATSIPLQNGLEILIDGESADLVTINRAFAGSYIEKGTHQIEIRFTPPGKAAGCIISLAALTAYAVYLVYSQTRRKGRTRT